MTKNNFTIFFIMLALISVPAFAQNGSKLILKTGTINPQPNLEQFVNKPNTTSPNAPYKIVSFYTTPTQEVKKSLQNNGVTFLEYVPNNSFIVKFSETVNFTFLNNKNIKGIYELPRALKLDYRIINWDIPSHAQSTNDEIKVAVIAMHGLNIKNYVGQLAQQNVVPYEFGGDTRFAYCKLSKDKIEDLAKKSWVRYIEIIDEPGRPESTEGRSIQKSNLINSKLSNGLTYNAEGVKLLVRDDGIVGPHIDYEGRLTNLTTDATGTHGDGVAGVMGGAGNIDPSVEGGASGADIFVINYAANFQDTTLGLHLFDSVMITNSSYSNGCNAGYTTTTQTVDNHVFNNQTLMHVFSAGNSNNNDCGYGAGDQWGNITGGHKMGKNVITVANLFNDGGLVNSSSRGPAHDGRIKPDLAAHGQGQMSTDPNNQYSPFGGTSSAAPSLAGNLAQLIEAYRTLNGGANPKSALLKAAAMNSATDLGNPGPDFRYGYGLINTARAHDVIANNQYLFDSISQNGTNNHTVVVPAGTGQLRIMLYWHDPAATPAVNQALINDLDLTVNNTLLPMVLDHTPNATTLNNPAAPAVDHLNNIEQVVVDNPTPGSYSVQVNGFQIPSGPQEYVLVYTFITDEIKVTYPLGGESLIPGNSEIIHWDDYGDTLSFNVEYSTDNGTSWNTIGTAPGNQRNFGWTVPNINSGDALVRVSRGAQNDVSDEAFNIFPVPNFSIAIKNANSIEVNWASIPTATKYYIWQLGNKYMEIIDSSSTNQYTLSGLMPGDNLWLSVSANNALITGERANAQNYIFNPSGSCDSCINSISGYPYAESFENGIGLFCQSSADDLDWTINSGTTPTQASGPFFASDGNEYIYLEASSPNFPSKNAILGSPCFDLSNAVSATMYFDYHMLGTGMGSLDIEVSTDGGNSWSPSPVWSQSGNQGTQWKSDSVDFSSYSSNKVSFRFMATTGTSARSDIAVDNIRFDADIQFPAGINNFNSGGRYSIQPNPSDGIFYINTTDKLKSIRVINSFGQIVKSNSTITASDRMINMTENAPGIYFVILQDDNNQYHRFKISLL